MQRICFNCLILLQYVSFSSVSVISKQVSKKHNMMNQEDFEFSRDWAGPEGP